MTDADAISRQYVLDESKSLVASSVIGLEHKRDAERIKGLVATTGVDKVNDRFTKDALQDIAKQIREDVETVGAWFRDGDEDALKQLQDEKYEGTTGNVDHDNDPAAAAIGAGDPRIVPAFKIVDAQYVEDPVADVEAGVEVTAEMNLKGMHPDVADAVKYSLKEGFIDSMSIEYIPQMSSKDEDVRVLEQVEVRGAAITARPANPSAKLTDVDLKSMLENKKSVAGVTFRGTKTGSLDESAIPNDDYASHYLFDADTKSDSSYPVVDADGYLRRANVEDAHQLGARGGVSADELEEKLRALNDEFDNPPIDFDDGGKNAMSDESQPVTQDELEEVKSQIDDLKETNESLKEQNEELKAQLEDREEMKTLEEDITDLEDEIKSIQSDVEPLQQKAQPEYDSELNAKAAKYAELVGKSEAMEDAEFYANKVASRTGKDVTADQFKSAVEEVTSDE